MLAINAAHWVFPIGWLYTAVLGNLVASVICLTVGLGVGLFIVPRLKRLASKFLHEHLAAHHEPLRDAIDHIAEHMVGDDGPVRHLIRLVSKICPDCGAPSEVGEACPCDKGSP